MYNEIVARMKAENNLPSKILPKLAVSINSTLHNLGKLSSKLKSEPFWEI